jgi:hypothetical protein
MIHYGSLGLLIGVVLASSSAAQAPAWRFHWQQGQVLTYRVEQATVASEVVDGKKTETKTRLNNIKRWQVLGVDGAGVATVQLTLQSLRVETTTPGGEVLVFDSANPTAGNAQMREQLSKFVGQPLAVLRVDAKGKVDEVKECKFGPATRYESEPPFVITLPEGASANQWERAYKITLAPPQGTNEQYEAVQKYVVRSAKGETLTVGLTTAIKGLPEAVADQAPLLQMQPEGEIVFNLAAGVLEKASLKVDKELKGHQGEGSSYHFQSTYTEQFLANQSH